MASFTRLFERITAPQLAEMLRSPTTPQPRIIDVRDSDFAGGHIRSAVNLPEDNFIADDDVDALVRKYKDESMIVFHCMLSQVRGPSCARRFISRMAVVLEDAEKKPDVRVLTGGFRNFYTVRASALTSVCVALHALVALKCAKLTQSCCERVSVSTDLQERRGRHRAVGNETKHGESAHHQRRRTVTRLL